MNIKQICLQLPKLIIIHEFFTQIAESAGFDKLQIVHLSGAFSVLHK